MGQLRFRLGGGAGRRQPTRDVSHDLPSAAAPKTISTMPPMIIADIPRPGSRALRGRNGPLGGIPFTERHRLGPGPAGYARICRWPRYLPPISAAGAR